MAEVPDTSPLEAAKRVPGAIRRLPPWAIFAALGAAVLVGLYLRNKRRNEERTEAQRETTPEMYDVNQGAYDPSAFSPELAQYYGGAGGEQYGYPISFPTETGFRNIPSLPSAQGAPNPTEPGGERAAAAAPGNVINIGMTGGGPPASPEPTQLRAAGVKGVSPTVNQRIQSAIHAAHEGHIKGTVGRSQIDRLAAQHPEWGPHTLAHGGKLRGHSTRF